MKKIILTLLTIISLQSIFSQEVAQNILVEHYTNSRCSICASKNPDFFDLLEDYNEIHLAYYPSSPYSSCIFSMHNATEADGRTSYYNIFGSTPRVVLNGETVAASSVLLQESRINAEVPNTTPFTIELSQEYIDEDSVKVTTTISTVSTTNLSTLTLQLMLAEKLIAYNAPNGENEHPDVFRKALYGLNGLSFTVPANGTDITFETTYSFDPDWIIEDLEVIAFIQDESDKTIKQSQITSRLGNFGNEPSLTAINTINETAIQIFPNPTNDVLNIAGLNENATISIYSILGENVMNTTTSNQSINTSQLQQGIYFIEIFDEGTRYVHRINKQ